MDSDRLEQKCQTYLHTLCVDIVDRSVGSEGNRKATDYFERILKSLGWETESQAFDAVDWENGGASLGVDGESFAISPSPYSLGCRVEAPLAACSSVEALEQIEMGGKLLLLHGEIAREQLMPKNFVFYNPEEHQHIIALLEKGAPDAILCATGRNAAAAGGVYPFPLIEDGDFDIPSVFMTEEEGRRLLPHVGKTAVLHSNSLRIPGKGCNVIARRGNPTGKRIVVTAHIDAKKGTPGAIDNASGAVVLLLLADLLRSDPVDVPVEIAAFNGEDYYAVPGQMLYLMKNQDRMGEIWFNINIDGAGYREGKTAFSFYDLPQEIEAHARAIVEASQGIVEGAQWVQGDHSMFIQNGCPAVAVSSAWFTENIDDQDVTHTPKDQIGIVDCGKLVEIAHALDRLIRNC
ncbi:MAG: M28 family peptidase [Anaerolineaceae bacterium]